MALQPQTNMNTKWKLGSSCKLFVRELREWRSGEIIGSSSDDKGDMVKVRCGSEIHEIYCDDPDLRIDNQLKQRIPRSKIEELKQSVKGTDVASILEQLLSVTGEIITEDAVHSTS